MKYNSYHLRIQFAHDKTMYMSFTKGFQEQNFKIKVGFLKHLKQL